MFVSDRVIDNEEVEKIRGNIVQNNHNIIRLIPVTDLFYEIYISSNDDVYKVIAYKSDAFNLRDTNSISLRNTPTIEDIEGIEQFRDKVFTINWNHLFNVGIIIKDSIRYITSNEEIYNKLKEMKLQTSNVYHCPMVPTHTTRFSGATWFSTISGTFITIIGAGGIGSFTAFYLSRMCRFVKIYDRDTVDETNLGGQLYTVEQIGMYKVQALRDTIARLGGSINPYIGNFDYTQVLMDPIVIGAVDNMEARKTIFNAFIESNTCKLLIDGRLTADELQVFVIDKNNPEAIEEYKEKWLFDDKEAAETVCSFKQTTYMAGMIASIITNVVVNYTAHMDDLLPFFIHYDANLFKFELQ